MNDLDALRTALLSSGLDEPMTVDVDRTMVQGSRIRRRRRLATGDAALAVTAALLIGVTGLAHRQPSVGDASPELVIGGGQAPDPTARPLGGVIDTGYRDAQGPHVLYVTADAGSGATSSHLDLTEGHRGAGTIVPEIMGSGTTFSSGFHALTRLLVHNGHDTPLFGYYAGPAAGITIQVNDRTVAAHLATWSQNNDIVVFWFDPSEVPISANIGGLRAVDAAGRPI